MSRAGEMKRALAVVWRNKSVLALHLAVNPALFGLVWLWLSVPESRVWLLLVSAALAGVIVIGAVWLHGATMLMFRLLSDPEGRAPVAGSFRAARGRLGALLVWAAGAAMIFALISRVAAWIPGAAEWLAAALAFLVRRAVPPHGLETALAIPIFILRWLAAPLLLLLLGSAVSERGFAALRGRGLDGALAALRAPALWLRSAALIAAGVGVPCLLVRWVPALEGIPAQAASMTVRFLLACSVMIGSWLVLLALIAQTGRTSEPPPVVAAPST